MDLSQYNFLVVDDHAFARKAVISQLNKFNASQPDEAADGIVALSMIKKKCETGKPYDIVFLDWSLPKMDGFDVLVACRKDERLSNMSIIMVSAETEDENVLRALSEGATAYIPKPFESELFGLKLSNVIGLKSGLAEFDGNG